MNAVHRSPRRPDLPVCPETHRPEACHHSLFEMPWLQGKLSGTWVATLAASPQPVRDAVVTGLRPVPSTGTFRLFMNNPALVISPRAYNARVGLAL